MADHICLVFTLVDRWAGSLTSHKWLTSCDSQRSGALHAELQPQNSPALCRQTKLTWALLGFGCSVESTEPTPPLISINDLNLPEPVLHRGSDPKPRKLKETQHTA